MYNPNPNPNPNHRRVRDGDTGGGAMSQQKAAEVCAELDAAKMYSAPRVRRGEWPRRGFARSSSQLTSIDDRALACPRVLFVRRALNLMS